MRSHPRLFVVVCLLGISGLFAPACSCEGSNDDVNQAEPHLSGPQVVDFGGVAVGITQGQNITLTNDGGDHTHLSAVVIEGEGAAHFHVTLPAEQVNAGGAQSARISFKPLIEGPQTATLVVRSDATDHPELRITLTGNGLPPAIRAEPSMLDFGTVMPMRSTSLTLTLTNTSSVVAEASLRFIDDVDQAFKWRDDGSRDDRPVTIQPGSPVDVDVTFQPTFGGPARGTLLVQFCGDGCGTRVPLTGILAAPRLHITPLRVEFGTVAQEGTAQRDVTMKNVGAAPLDVTAADVIAGADVFSVDAALPRTLQPDEEMAAHITFDARSQGQVEGQLRVRSSDTRSPEVLIELVGATTGSDLVAVPGALDFGVLTRDEPVDGDVMLLNRGDQPATLDGVTLDSQLFTLRAVPELPLVLGPGGVVILPITFVPDGLGPRMAQLVVHSDNVTRATLNVPLMATRTDRACAVTVSTEEVNFGALRVGQRGERNFVVRNVGTGVCSVSPAVLSPVYSNDPGFSAAGAGGMVMPGDSRRFTVVFSPTSRGQARAVINVGIAGLPPVLVAARGAGVLGSLSVNPTVLDFGQVPLGCTTTVTRQATLLSDGADPVTVELPEVVSGPYTLSAPGLPGQMQPGSAITITVSFSPPALGDFPGSIHIGGLTPEPIELFIELRGQGAESSSPVSEEFHVDTTQAMDVLFIVDNSGSMEDNQMRLSQNLRRFIEVADFRATVDYHLGVTTTDPTPGIAGVLVGMPAFITRQSPDPIGTFTARALVGITGSPDEQGLEAARAALSPPVLTTENAGFLRTSAGLAIVIVSDEEDHSPLAVADYVNFFRGLKSGSNSAVVISAITGGASGCMDLSSQDQAFAAPRYVDAVQSTGGINADICAQDWGSSLRSVGEAVFLARGRFTIQQPAAPGTVQVTLNGQPQTTGWTYDDATRTVIFDNQHVPPAGATVKVTYVPTC